VLTCFDVLSRDGLSAATAGGIRSPRAARLPIIWTYAVRPDSEVASQSCTIEVAVDYVSHLRDCVIPVVGYLPVVTGVSHAPVFFVNCEFQLLPTYPIKNPTSFRIQCNTSRGNDCSSGKLFGIELSRFYTGECCDGCQFM
jgi:hypothetical protein